MELINPKSQYNEEVENKLNFEQEILSSKFKIVCEKLREMKKVYNDAKSIIKNDILSIKNSVVKMEKLVEGIDNNQHKVLTHQVQKLKETNHIKNKELYFMKNKVKELERRNECNVSKINTQKKITRI